MEKAKQLILEKINEYNIAEQKARDKSDVIMTLMYINQKIGLQEALDIINHSDNDKDRNQQQS